MAGGTDKGRGWDRNCSCYRRDRCYSATTCPGDEPCGGYKESTKTYNRCLFPWVSSIFITAPLLEFGTETSIRNGGSIPPRLPGLSSVLKLLQSSTPTSPRYTVVALSYRGFWTSRGRPSERGISLDASAALRYVNEHLASDPSGKTSIVLWGQSIGAGVATSAAAAANCSSSSSAFVKDAAVTSKSIPIRGLLLETPFTSVKAMLLAIYPQKWLPYRYLYPFLRNDWNSKSALRKIANASCSAPNILILQAGSDELVPPTHGIELESVASELNIDTKRIEVYGALHHEAAMKRRGREEIVDFLKGIK